MVVTPDVRSHRGDPPDFSGRPAPPRRPGGRASETGPRHADGL